MERIDKQELWSFLDDSLDAKEVELNDVRSDPGHLVNSYLELAKKVAELHFRNKDFVLLYRGQQTEFKKINNGFTTLIPTLLRPKEQGQPSSNTLTKRFDRLKAAEDELTNQYKIKKLMGEDRLKRYRILRWAILQHYEVCPTPLLDVTASLRIAASFASCSQTDEAFVFVIGVPNLSGAVTASSEAGLQIVRLASTCPPVALRPHIQEGYLIGEYPELADFDQKANYKHYEIDFGRRLVAKFRFNPKTFWKDQNFPKVSPEALRPSESQDPLFKLTLKIKNSIHNL